MLTVMVLFVFGLTYQAKHSSPPDPTYDFYDTAFVHVEIHGSEGIHDLYGRYNHILHGQRVLIKAVEDQQGQYLLEFPVYSPRPAMLYVDDEALEIFLNPGDTTLHIDLWYEASSYSFDSIHFSGNLASVCEYYLEKARKFNRSHIRGLRNTVEANDFARFSASLDSMAAWELGMLAEQEILTELPEWFVGFERNDILYQKAYLKLAQSYNRDIDPTLLDKPPLDNQTAEFSYYYYLYLHTFFSNQVKNEHAADSLEHELEVAYQLASADSLLSGSPHDVFFTRMIFALIQQEKLELAREMLSKFETHFSSKKYFRYLRKCLQDATPVT